MDLFNRTAAARTCLSISLAVEKAGFSSLAEGAKVSYEIISDRGKESAGNLRL
jgi:cold shock CspA family protein